jgi:hypothetical protein
MKPSPASVPSGCREQHAAPLYCARRRAVNRITAIVTLDFKKLDPTRDFGVAVVLLVPLIVLEAIHQSDYWFVV